jgi:hypothetical protein
MSDKSQDQNLQAGVGNAVGDGFAPIVSTTDDYAESWYKDALIEARSGGGDDTRRREILFAICFAESFLFEWARDKVGHLNIDNHFPSAPRFARDPQYRRGLKDKWNEVPQELHKAGAITICPTLHLSRLGNLIVYRDGLVHAAASRPAISPQPCNMAAPFPTRKNLKSLKAGWAVKIVYDLVLELCNQINDPEPAYLQLP